MASSGAPGFGGSALHGSLEPSSTESKAEEPTQFSSPESGSLLLDTVERLEGIRSARRFERLGMVHLLRLQVAIHQLETLFWNERSSEMLEAPESPEESLLFKMLMRYNEALLEQKQILALPKLVLKEDSASNKALKDVFEKAGLWKSEDFVSLDPCSCPPDCPPKGINRFLYLPLWEDYFKKENENLPHRPSQTSRRGKKSLRDCLSGSLSFIKDFLIGLLLVGFFAVLPAASILVLYVIPTSHKRLWAILGESVFLVCVLTAWNTWSTEKRDILAYMTGIAAVQVIFVGSVIGAGGA